MILYTSTRDNKKRITGAQAILQGLSEDGGLFVPERLPDFHLDFNELAVSNYQEIAYEVFKEFLTDFSEEELKYCIHSAYDEKFATQLIAPVVKHGKDYYLELFHGQTLAFKDMALSILPYLMTTAAKKEGLDKEIVILTATSGDTGKAAMAGFADVPGTKIIVFYPKNGVSAFQEKQMLTQKGENTFLVGIPGNFDDAQRHVKEMFNNRELKEKLAKQNYVFSSANSINIGRLLPQIVYYVYAYAQLIATKEIQNGEAINVSVPTGNFGNILAAYYAKQIGVPIEKLICASNQNNVLTDFFQQGIYDKNREFFVTNSPSMDILVSSNLERLVYYLTNSSADVTGQLMTKLANDGVYSLNDTMKAKLEDFYGNFSTEQEIVQTIKEVFAETEYVIDPHTAVSVDVLRKFQKETNNQTKTVIVSTASPYKFPEVVVHSIDPQAKILSEDDLINQLVSLTRQPAPTQVTELKYAKILHDTVIDTADMQKTVERILEI